MEKNIKIFKLVDEAELRPPKKSNQRKKMVNLYKFDIKLPKDAWIGYNLPKKYDDILEKAYFAIEPKALDTIEYLLSEAPVQRYNPLYRHYDTIVRENLMDIGATFLHKAIYLISDYYFDINEGYYSRISKDILPKYVIASFAIYKYWNGRTGRGLQYTNAGFDKYYYRYSEDNIISSYYYIAQEIKNYERIQEQNISKPMFEKESKFTIGLSDIFPLEEHVIRVTYEIDNKKTEEFIDVKGQDSVICMNMAKNKFYKNKEQNLNDHLIENVEFSFNN